MKIIETPPFMEKENALMMCKRELNEFLATGQDWCELETGQYAPAYALERYKQVIKMMENNKQIDRCTLYVISNKGKIYGRRIQK